MSGPRTSRRHVRRVQWPMVLWLTLVWWVLWHSWTLLSLVGGVLVGVLACVVFPLPPLRLRVRVHPVGLLVLTGRFVADVVVASLQVARTTLFPRADLRNALVMVPLRTESDIVLVATAEMVSLVPGSVVVEAHRPSHTLFLHVLDVRGEGDLDRVRRQVWAQEARILAAFGTDGRAADPAGPADPADPADEVSAR